MRGASSHAALHVGALLAFGTAQQAADHVLKV